MVERRIKQEIEEQNTSSVFGCFDVGPIGEDLYQWKAFMVGPQQTPYAGGIFELEIKLSKDYPFKPPKVRFVTPIYHANVNVDGHLWLDILHGILQRTGVGLSCVDIESPVNSYRGGIREINNTDVSEIFDILDGVDTII